MEASLPLAPRSPAKHLILTVPTFLLALSGYHLAVDFRSDYLGAESGQPLAFVKTVDGDVKRRATSRFRWFDVADEQDLYPQDSVRTTDHSRVGIRFNDGAKLDVGENSLVVLQKSGSKVSIHLVSGQAKVISGRAPLLLTTNQVHHQTLEVTHGELTLSATGNTTRFTVRSGSATLDEKGKTQTIKRDERVELAPTGQVTVSRAVQDLSAPAPNAIFVATNHPHEKVATALVPFSWNTAKGWEDPHLEISDSAEFATVNEHIKVFGQHRELSMKPGNYFWRIKGAAPDQISEVRPIRVVTREPVKLLSPAHEIRALTNEEHKINPVLMSWVGPGYADSYQVEVSKDPTFKKNVKTIDAKAETRAIFTPDEPGKFYWRVKSESKGAHLTETSTPETIAITAPPHAKTAPREAKRTAVAIPLASTGSSKSKEAAPKLAINAHPGKPGPLEILSPKPGHKFLPELSAKTKNKPQDRIEFTWQGGTTPKVALLLWQKSPDTQATRKKHYHKTWHQVLNQELDNTTPGIRSYTWVATSPGIYKWEIIAKNPQIQGPYRSIAMVTPEAESKVFDFEIKKRFQGVRPYDPLFAGQKVWSNRLTTHLLNNFSVTFRWEPLSGAKSYRIAFYSEGVGRNKPIFQKSVDEPELTMKKDILWAAPQLSYQIEAFLPNGFVARSAMEPFHFEIAPPSPTFPANNAVLKLGRKPSTRFALLTWRKTNFTDSYVLEFSKDPRFRKVLTRKTLTDNFYLQSLEPGNYWWRVRGFSKPFYSQPSHAFKLTVRSGAHRNTNGIIRSSED